MQLKVEKVDLNNVKFLKLFLKPELLNLSNKDILKEKIESEIKGNNKNFIFDFSEINALNSSALGILIGVLNIINRAGGTLKLANYNKKIKTILEITKLNLVFDLI